MKSLLLFVYITFACIYSFSQTAYSPKLLIPYNDHGKWGWCDTLGKIHIEPQFDECSFFDVKGVCWSSVVEKQNKIYPYVFGKGLLPLQNCKIIHQYEHLLKKDLWLVSTINGNTGIYNWKKNKLILDTIAKSYIVDDSLPNYFLYKVQSTGKYYLFDLKTKKSKLTDMDYYVWFSDTRITYFKKSVQSDEWFVLNRDGEFHKVTVNFNENQLITFGSKDDLVNKKAKLNNYKIKNLNLPLDYKGVSYIDLYDNAYLVFEKDSKIGLLDYTKGETILDPVFTNIKYDFKQNYFMLYDNDKKGVKLLETVYPTIEPIYKSIDFSKSIQVNGNWYFMVFKVEKNGIVGYVGENGIEYFSK